MLKPVVQEEVTGCAIASVAAVAGVSYQKAKTAANALGIYAADEKLWSDTAHVRKLLAHYNMAAAPSKIPFRSWSLLPDFALLATQWHLSKGRPFWHLEIHSRIGR